ncbi:NADP oxidoreductase [Leptospira langatensis]|uniref:NADP oxidoreductase n=1 Tax=Leptospira langatensis TaxID=2484983 RepID=A0A5F1ZTC8_9LEPT|nr:NAD(P)-binding domain-containing protein [Leptospira langatensis]TGK03043.1 NADP oxidoreductase [Leptospira langatensis]TGL41799.1 NADP oxidoreductase [Leptospira langatensis]
MKIGILGTGMVGNTIGSKLIEKGYEVKMGSRSVQNEKAAEWVAKSGSKASQGTFKDAAAFGEILFNCTKGEVSIEVLRQAGAENLKGKILVDVSNALDFSKGRPPGLLTDSHNSLGEMIQKEFPDVKVVKTLNTTNCSIMVDASLIKGEHDIFICGNDAAAKKTISDLLVKDFGWKNIVDLGDIVGARAAEMLLPLWVRLYGIYGHANFNFHIVK